MSSTEEKKKLPKKKTTVSGLTSFQTIMGEKTFDKISKDPMNLILAMAGKEAPNSNFAGKNMRGANFDGYNLEDSDFSGCDLRDASFKDCYMPSCNFIGAKMQNITFDGSTLDGSDFSRVNLTGGRMRNVQMHGVVLYDSVLNGADMSYSTLDDADLNNTSFRGTILRGINAERLFVPVLPPGQNGTISFENADLTCATIQFDNQAEEKILVKGSILIGAHLSDFEINDSVLEDMDFGRSQLQKVIFKKSIFNRVNFSKVSLIETRFEYCSINNSNFDSANYRDSIYDNSTFDKCKFNHIDGKLFLHSVVISNSSFSSEQNKSTSLDFNDIKSKLLNCEFNGGGITFYKLGEGFILKGCSFGEVKFDYIEKISISDCFFRESNFPGMSYSNITNTEFFKISFSTTYMKNNFNNVIFSDAYFHGSIFKNNVFRNNTFRDIKLISSTFNKNSYIDSTTENLRKTGINSLGEADRNFFGDSGKIIDLFDSEDEKSSSSENSKKITRRKSPIERDEKNHSSSKHMTQTDGTISSSNRSRNPEPRQESKESSSESPSIIRLKKSPKKIGKTFSSSSSFVASRKNSSSSSPIRIVAKKKASEQLESSSSEDV